MTGAKVRGEELWARRCVAAALGDVHVSHHDDGTRPGMFDLKLVYPDGRTGAVEITAAADSESIELWNLMNGRGGRWQVQNLTGGWSVDLVPKARARRVHAELPALLAELERLGVRELQVHRWDTGKLSTRVYDLGIAHAFRGETGYPGSIHVTIYQPPERSGGMVAETGDALAIWIGKWLREPKQAHNLEKLERSGAQERHLFVIVPGFAEAPFGVIDLLMREGAPLPTVPPDLPEAITDVWAMSTWDSGNGMRWSPTSGWEPFDKKRALKS